MCCNPIKCIDRVKASTTFSTYPTTAPEESSEDSEHDTCFVVALYAHGRHDDRTLYEQVGSYATEEMAVHFWVFKYNSPRNELGTLDATSFEAGRGKDVDGATHIERCFPRAIDRCLWS